MLKLGGVNTWKPHRALYFRWSQTQTHWFVGSDRRRREIRPNEDVDIAATPDGGFNVGYIEAGECWRYTVDVTKTSEARIENVAIWCTHPTYT